MRLAAGAPRSWFREGEEIRVKRAATRFGPLSYRLHSAVAAGRITAEIQPLARTSPAAAIELRLRHPDKALIQEVSVAGARGHQIDQTGERVLLQPSSEVITVEARCASQWRLPATTAP